MKNELPEDWKILRQWLPDKAALAIMARQHGFLTRVKGVRDMDVWLRLILMHGGGGLSLEQTVMRAAELRLAKLSPISLHNRLLKAGAWLEAITKHLLENRPARPVPLDNALLERLLAIDATDVSAPASTGTDWRVHYSLKLSDLSCAHLELTDKHGGETLKRFAFGPGQIALADRGYCKRAQVAHVLEAGARIVVRYCPKNFPLLDENGQRFEVLAWLRKLPGQRAGESNVWFEHAGRKWALRLCAVRMSRTAAQKALNKVRRKARQHNNQVQPQTEEMSGYIMVLTNLEAKEHGAAEVLKLYRYRWQVELVFKRFKTLLSLGELPKHNEQSARTWVQAKIITALLVERAMMKARFFPPWGYEL